MKENLRSVERGRGSERDIAAVTLRSGGRDLAGVDGRIARDLQRCQAGDRVGRCIPEEGAARDRQRMPGPEHLAVKDDLASGERGVLAERHCSFKRLCAGRADGCGIDCGRSADGQRRQSRNRVAGRIAEDRVAVDFQ